MKIILIDIHDYLFPEYQNNRKNRFILYRDYLRDKRKNNDLEAVRNIKFVVKITKLSLHIENKMTRVFLKSLYEQLIEISFDWHKPYDWHELKPILLFFTIFSDARSIRDLERIIKKPNTNRMIDKYRIIPKMAFSDERA